MTWSRAWIPYGRYWSSPFSRWQGGLAGQHSLKLAAQVGAAAFARWELSPEVLDSIHYGTTVPQKQSFYGAPWLAGLLGAPGITGPTVAQACATSPRLLLGAADAIELGRATRIAAIAADRCSNGPTIVYHDPTAPGGTNSVENCVWDNFGHDPWAKNPILQTAENVAREGGISKEEQDAVALIRAQQYEDALADDRAFQRRYMVPVELRRGRKVLGTIEADEGIHPTTAEGLARLRAVMPEGTVSYGTQTHPADGNAGMLVCTRDAARELSADPGVEVQLLAAGSARVEKGFMAKAVVPAAQRACQDAGVGITALDAIKTHNPFAVNDVWFCRQTGVAPEAMNNFGSSLVYGHPQGPTGLRLIVELIEELALKGGGTGLFAGCAAGDTAMALVLRVTS